jgi:hypothetical protein
VKRSVVCHIDAAKALGRSAYTSPAPPEVYCFLLVLMPVLVLPLLASSTKLYATTSRRLL